MRLDYWDASMETGFPQIDKTYSQLAQNLADLQRGLAVSDPQSLLATLTPMIRRLDEHFTEEEELMRRYGYPLVEQHVNTHNTFLRLLRRYEARLQAGENVGRKVTYDLKIWLSNHVKLQDGDFAKFSRRGPSRNPMRWLSALLG